MQKFAKLKSKKNVSTSLWIYNWNAIIFFLCPLDNYQLLLILKLKIQGNDSQDNSKQLVNAKKEMDSTKMPPSEDKSSYDTLILDESSLASLPEANDNSKRPEARGVVM